MGLVPLPVPQLGLPEFVPDLIGLAGSLVLVLIIVALGGIVYRTLTGGIEWPDEREDDEDAVRKGSQDEEWDYY